MLVYQRVYIYIEEVIVGNYYRLYIYMTIRPSPTIIICTVYVTLQHFGAPLHGFNSQDQVHVGSSENVWLVVGTFFIVPYIGNNHPN